MIGDFWCHYAWMKVTHRQPIEKWYNTGEFTHLDYPALIAYQHYFMGFIFQQFDKQGFFNEALYGYGIVTPRNKMGMRVSILVLNVVMYYPMVLYAVLKSLRNFSKLHQVAVILLLLNYPTFAYVEFTNTMVNGPHIGFLLLAVHFALSEQLIWATIAFTLTLLCKHAVGPFVFPIAVYMMALTWAKHAKTVKSV